MDSKENLNPTALIPFCEFGGNMSAMGVKIKQFDVPVCNSFKAKIIKDHLCYEVDPNEFRTESQNKLELNILIDFNEDRQVYPMNVLNKKDSIIETYQLNSFQVDSEEKNFILIDTIGIFQVSFINFPGIV